MKRDSWNRFWSETYMSNNQDVYSLINRTKFEYLKRLIAPSGNSLEVGAGAAHLSALLAERGYNATCLDYSEEALKAAQTNFQSRGLSARFVYGDAMALPFPNNHFDLVFSTGLLEHYEDPSPITKEMVRVLKPKGLFYSDIVPEKFSLLRAFKRWQRPVIGMDDFFERRFTRQEIDQLLISSNLSEVVVFPAGVYPPELPFFRRFKMYRRLALTFTKRTERFWRRLDNTKIADWLGFYYFTSGTK